MHFHFHKKVILQFNIAAVMYVFICVQNTDEPVRPCTLYSALPRDTLTLSFTLPWSVMKRHRANHNPLQCFVNTLDHKQTPAPDWSDVLCNKKLMPKITLRMTKPLQCPSNNPITHSISLLLPLFLPRSFSLLI